MDKEAYIKQALEIITNKNLVAPFQIAPGSTVTDLDYYLKSLINSYLKNTDPRLTQLFKDKIEHLKNL